MTMEEILNSMCIRSNKMVDFITNSGDYGDSVVRASMKVSLRNQVVIMSALELLLERTKK